jgi:hypothetical protein
MAFPYFGCRGIEPVMKLFVVTATRLRDGSILWLGRGRVWHERFSQAYAMPEADLVGELAFGAAEVAAQRVIGVYKVEVDEQHGQITPATTRERIRAVGPSVRPDLSYAHSMGDR